jgi:hypothetical protein
MRRYPPSPAPSSTKRWRGSSKAVMASSNDTPCLSMLAAALASSHSKSPRTTVATRWNYGTDTIGVNPILSAIARRPLRSRHLGGRASPRSRPTSSCDAQKLQGDQDSARSSGARGNGGFEAMCAFECRSHAFCAYSRKSTVLGAVNDAESPRACPFHVAPDHRGRREWKGTLQGRGVQPRAAERPALFCSCT